MKIVIVYISAILWVFIIICKPTVWAFEISSEKLDLNKKSAVIFLQDAVGEPFECEELFKKNKLALKELFSPASLDKAGVQVVYL